MRLPWGWLQWGQAWPGWPVSGVVIYRVLTGQASFSALALPLLIIAALIGARSLFQY